MCRLHLLELKAKVEAQLYHDVLKSFGGVVPSNTPEHLDRIQREAQRMLDVAALAGKTTARYTVEVTPNPVRSDVIDMSFFKDGRKLTWVDFEAEFGHFREAAMLEAWR